MRTSIPSRTPSRIYFNSFYILLGIHSEMLIEIFFWKFIRNINQEFFLAIFSVAYPGVSPNILLQIVKLHTSTDFSDFLDFFQEFHQSFLKKLSNVFNQEFLQKFLLWASFRNCFYISFQVFLQKYLHRLLSILRISLKNLPLFFFLEIPSGILSKKLF